MVPALRQPDGKGNQSGDAGNQAEMQDLAYKKPSIFLSEDIWQKVAVHMPTKDWVRVSGTCKAMSKVCTALLREELDDQTTYYLRSYQGDLLESSTPNAVVWATKHSHKVENIDLRLLNWTQHKSRAIMAALRANDWDIRQVQTLCVSLDPWQRWDTLWERFAKHLRTADDPQKWRWISEMLSTASDAKQIYLKGEGMGETVLHTFGVPALMHLTHLGVTTPIPLFTSQSFQRLIALEALTIWKGSSQPDMEGLLPLNLTGCNALQEVNLENVMPSSLICRAGVDLHLTWQESPALVDNWMYSRLRCTTLKVTAHQSWFPLELSAQLIRMMLLGCPVLRMFELNCRNRTGPGVLHLVVSHAHDLKVEDVPAFAAVISMLAYKESELLSEGTKLLVEHCQNPWVWQKKSELTFVGPDCHLFCRRWEWLTQAWYPYHD